MTAAGHHRVAVSAEAFSDETTVPMTIALDDVVELFELLAFCRALCVIAPHHINAAMAEHVVNGYNAQALAADLEALSRRLYQAAP